MFVSANFLAINYGVDDTIAKFFADREPPKDNLYWKDKLMYLRPEPGWLFIPLIVDLLFKAGVSKTDLLSDKFIALMEHIGDVSAREETGLISAVDAIAIISSELREKEVTPFLEELDDFMHGGINNPFTSLATPFKSLHRGDLFLYSLTALPLTTDLQVTAIKYWFALITTLLLLDDADDIETDRTSGDQNAFLECGLTHSGINSIKELVRSNLAFIAFLNRPMATTLDKKFVGLSKKPFISELLTQ